MTSPPMNISLSTVLEFEGRDEKVPVQSTAVEITFAQVQLVC